MKRLLAILWVGMGLWAGPALAGPNTNVPWSDTFETYTNLTPLINGRNGWYGSTNTIIVQTNIAYTGSTNAARIPSDSILSNRFQSVACTTAWLQMDLRPTLYDTLATPVVDTNQSVMFYVYSNGYFVVYDGSTREWVVVSNMASGAQAPRVLETNWVHLYIYQNYTNHTWSLFLSNNLIKDSIGFVNTNISSMNGFDFYNYVGTTSYLDNVSLTSTSPPEFQQQGTNWLPYLVVSPTSLSRTILNGTNAPSQAFEVWKTNGSLSIVYSISESVDWLTISPSSGTSAGEHDTINVTYSTANLAPSPTPYTTTIQVAATDTIFGYNALNSPQTVNVSVLVQARPETRIDPPELTNVVTIGHRAPAQSLQVWNGSPVPRTPMAFTVTNDSTWITISPTNGYCVDNTNTLTFTYPTEALSTGWKTGTVVIATEASNTIMKVKMRVNAVPVIGFNTGGLTNLVKVGQNALTQYFTIRNASAEPRGTLRYNLEDNMTWASLSPTEGTSAGETETITVTYNTADLPVGIYSGTITATGTDDSTGDSVTAAEITVTLTVEGQAQLSTSADALSDSVLENCKATNTFRLWNGSMVPRGQMSYVISENIDWLSVTPASGTISDETNTITILYDAGTMATGTYTGTITIDALDIKTGTRALEAPKSLVVTLVVNPRTPINYERPEVRGILFVGQTLNAWRGLWQNDNLLTFAYQWQMANDKLGNGLVDITDSQGILITATNYVVTAEVKAQYLRIKVTATDAIPSPATTTAYSEFADAKRIKAPVDDFSGDGRTDLWLFDTSSGIWRVAFTTDNNAQLVFGGPGHSAEPGDYDGDGIFDPAIYAVDTGLWTVMLSASGYASASVIFGGTGYTPITSDYDGDCKTDPAIYEEATGLWMVLMSANSYMPASATFGGPGHQAVPGDYDGDGKTDPAIYQASSGLWQVMLSGSSYATAGLMFGGPDFTPTPGDYDGDGKTDIAVYWAAWNHWWLRASSTGVIREESFGTSAGSGIPVPGYYDSDAQCDPATVHPYGDYIIWSIQRSSLGYRGQSFQIDTDRWRVSW